MMKVLWFSITPFATGDTREGCWVNAQAALMTRHCPDIDLSIAYQADEEAQFVSNGVTCYAMKAEFKGVIQKIGKAIHHPYAEWQALRPAVEKVIQAVRPDLICCFGSEWPFGLVASWVKVPVVIHMQGFLGIYTRQWRKVEPYRILFKFYRYSPFRIVKTLVRHSMENLAIRREKEVMRLNRFFLGRTLWDHQLVEQYAPGARYYHCEEAIRGSIVHSPLRWRPQSGKMQLVSISSAGELKGNGFILKTAKVLKQRCIDFTWKVAGRKSVFSKFECYTGIRHDDVNIELLGMIDAEQIAQLLSSSMAYVHTAVIDNSPNTLCEAQLVGCPVVTTKVGGIPQLVTEGETGLFTDYDNPDQLANILIQLYGDQALQQHMSDCEKSVAHHRHDETRIAERLSSIYREIIDTYNI